MKSVRAKFLCVSVKDTQHGKFIEMAAVMGDTPENKAFNDYTPNGKLDFHIAPDKPAGEYFAPGKQYHIDITEVQAN